MSMDTLQKIIPTLYHIEKVVNAEEVKEGLTSTHDNDEMFNSPNYII